MRVWARIALVSIASHGGGVYAQTTQELPVILPETTDWSTHVVSWFGRRISLVANPSSGTTPCLLVEDFRSGGAWILGVDGIVVDTYPRTERRFGSSACALVLAGDHDGDGRVEYVLREGSSWSFVEPTSGDRRWYVAGDELVELGDLDADGCTEFAVVTRHVRANGEERSRIILRSFGHDPERWRFDAQRTRGLVRVRASRAPDIDGDGVADLVALVENGAVVLSGRDGRRLARLGEIDGDVVRSVAPVGDVDGDGVQDFALGHPSSDSCGEARVDVVSLRDSALLRRMRGMGTFGEQLVAGADLDGDGVTEILVPSDGCGGEGVDVFSGRTGARLRSFTSDWGCHRVCWALLVPDVDGDGVEEIAIGTTEFMGANCDDGSVTLWSGKDGERLQLWTWHTPAIQALWRDVSSDSAQPR